MKAGVVGVVKRAEFYRGKIGSVFQAETGKLFAFHSTAVEVLAGWPRMLAWVKEATRPNWRPFRPPIEIPPDLRRRIEVAEGRADWRGQLYLPPPVGRRGRRESRNIRAWLSWFALIPDDVRVAVRAVPSRHWHLLSLVARCGSAALDLLVSNPALAYALASSWIFRDPPVAKPLRSARALLARGKSQRDILGWLGFPPTRSARRILARVVAGEICLPFLLDLRRALADDRARSWLAHVPRVNRSLAAVLARPELREMVTPKLLREISLRTKDDGGPLPALFMSDLHYMWTVVHPRRSPPRFESIASALNCHDDLIPEFNRAVRHVKLPGLPPPPIPGTGTIIPLTTTQELVDEGIEQQNCVASYANRISYRRHIYIYRLLEPERCTLSLVRRGRRWQLGELAARANRRPSPAAVAAVQQWLEANYRKGLPVSPHVPRYYDGAG